MSFTAVFSLTVSSLFSSHNVSVDHVAFSTAHVVTDHVLVSDFLDDPPPPPDDLEHVYVHLEVNAKFQVIRVAKSNFSSKSISNPLSNIYMLRF